MTDVATAPSAEDARRVARALVGDEPTPEEIARWLSAVTTVALPLDRPVDLALWSIARGGGLGLGLVDAGLALTEPYSPVRHRLYLMLAVLEASPAHVARFVAQDRPPVLAVAALGFRGTLAALRAVAGVAFVTAWRALAR